MLSAKEAREKHEKLEHAEKKIKMYVSKIIEMASSSVESRAKTSFNTWFCTTPIRVGLAPAVKKETESYFYKKGYEASIKEYKTHMQKEMVQFSIELKWY